MNELTFQDLRRKEVVNVEDGRRLGNICDIVFEQCSGKVLGIVVPALRRMFSFKQRQDVFISYHSICKIGEDVILVNIVYDNKCCSPNNFGGCNNQCGGNFLNE